MSRPFSTSLRRGGGEPRDLLARVDAEIRERIGEAVDLACLEVMVNSRHRGGLPAPAPESASDRAEFDRRVDAFLARLEATLIAALDVDQRPPLPTPDRARTDPLGERLDVQLALAKLLPDYWQRFEDVRVAYAAEVGAPDSPSSGHRARWLDRLLGR